MIDHSGGPLVAPSRPSVRIRNMFRVQHGCVVLLLENFLETLEEHWLGNHRALNLWLLQYFVLRIYSRRGHMHNVNWYAQRPLDATSLTDQGIIEQVSSTDRSKDISDPFRLTMEMAVEWAHLGGD